MIGTEARIGIQIDADNRGHEAFVEAARDNDRLAKSMEELVRSSRETADASQFMVTALAAAAEETKNLAAEQRKLAEEEARAREGAARMKAMHDEFVSSSHAADLATKAHRESLMQWGFAAATVAIATIKASDFVGDFQERMEITSETLGVSVKQLAGIELGLGNMGRKLEDVLPSLDIFVRKLGAARLGDKGALADFAGAGVVSGFDRSNVEILQEVGRSLAAIEDPAIRGERAFQLLGRSWRQLLPVLLQDLGDLSDQAVKSGRVMEGAMEDMAKGADASGDKLRAAFGGLRLQLLGSLAPVGTGIKSFAAEAISDLAGLIAWINRSNAELGHLQVNLTGSGPMLKLVGPAEGTPLGNFFSGGLHTQVQNMAFGGGEAVPERPGVQHGPFLSADDTKQMQEAADASKKLAEEQEKQVQAVLDQIAGMERLRDAGHLLVDDEIARLSKLQDQAIAIQDRVVRERELLAIRREMASLLDQEDRPSGAALTRTPTFKGELMTPQFMQGAGITQGTGLPDVKGFAEFGKQAEDNFKSFDPSTLSELDRVLAETGEEVERLSHRMEGVAETFKLTGEESALFARMVQASQHEIAAAYAISDQAGHKAAKRIADEAKAQQRTVELNRQSVESIGGAVRGVVHAAITDFEHLGNAIGSIVEHLIQQILEAAIISTIKSFIPIPGLAAGGTIAMAEGGTVAMPFIQAQHGLMLSGVRGRDTLPVMAQKGELFISRQDTDDLREFLRGQRQQSVAPAAGGGPSSLELHYHGSGAGPLPHERSEIIDWLRNDVMPLWQEAHARGGYRRGR